MHCEELLSPTIQHILQHNFILKLLYQKTIDISRIPLVNSNFLHPTAAEHRMTAPKLPGSRILSQTTVTGRSLCSVLTLDTSGVSNIPEKHLE